MKFPNLAWNKERDSLDNILQVGQEQKNLFLHPVFYTLYKNQEYHCAHKNVIHGN